MSGRVSVAGIGGVFFKARDPAALAAWYRDQLGVSVAPEGTHAVFAAGPDGRDATGAPVAVVWSAFPADTAYFGPGPAGWMVNYRVSDLDAMLSQLRAAGVWVAEKVEESDFGRFAWAADPEGTRFELWQPPPDGPPASSDASAA
jgi:predicted enzyme related to lactoylglutathione lyase